MGRHSLQRPKPRWPLQVAATGVAVVLFTVVPVLLVGNDETLTVAAPTSAAHTQPSPSMLLVPTTSVRQHYTHIPGAEKDGQSAPSTATTTRKRSSTTHAQTSGNASTSNSAPPQSAPTSVAAAPPVSGTAAAAFNWGTPLPNSDEFNYNGTPDSSKWASISGCGTGNAGNGKRCGANTTVLGTFLRETSDASGNTGWLANQTNSQYGRWEARVRITALGGGKPYHPVLLLWPKSEQWPQGGELDYMETDVGATDINVFLHKPGNDGSAQDHFSAAVDISQWHNYAIDWQPSSIKVYVDGVQIANDTSASVQPPGPMHPTIQLDNTGGSSQPAQMDVDWFHAYAA